MYESSSEQPYSIAFVHKINKQQISKTYIGVKDNNAMYIFFSPTLYNHNNKIRKGFTSR